MHYVNNTELSSVEETRSQFNGGTGAIKLGIDVHQDFYVVVEQEGGSNPKPPQRFGKEAFLHWAAKLARSGNADIAPPFVWARVRPWLFFGQIRTLELRNSARLVQTTISGDTQRFDSD